MPEIRPEEHVGPLNTVETMLLRGDGARLDQDIRNLAEIVRNLEASLVAKKRELGEQRAKKTRILREIVKNRGKDPLDLPIRELDRPGDGTLWVVFGGNPPDGQT